MRLSGMILMTLSWGVILALVIGSFYLLFKYERTDQDRDKR